MSLSERGAAMSAPISVKPVSYRWLRRTSALMLVGLGVLLISSVLAATQGAVAIPVGTIWQMLLNQLPFVRDLLGITPHWSAAQEAVVIQIRLPRIVLAGVVGACLATAGATYQGMFRNPLADPYLIGVASGAGLGATVALALPLHPALYGAGVVQWLAFGGALATVTVVSLLARVGKAMPLTTLLLAGVAIGSFANALTSFIMYMESDHLEVVYIWLLGGLAMGSWQQILAVLPYAVVSCTAIFLCAGRLNVLQLDEEQAAELGIDVERLKLVLIAAATLATAAAVSVSGLIGFVGLIVPHAVRLVWGPNYRLLLPLSALLGAIFLVWADTVARTVLAPTEIPIGVMTALCGAPFFLYLLRQRKRMVF